MSYLALVGTAVNGPIK